MSFTTSLAPTMLGMMRYHNIESKEFLDFIDDIDISHFKPNQYSGQFYAAIAP